MMGAELSGRFYNIALAMFAVGYAMLLWGLMHADPPQAQGAPADSFTQPYVQGTGPSRVALTLAVQASASKGLGQGPSGVHSSCEASGAGDLCTVSGFTSTDGASNCSIYVFVPGLSGSAYVRDTQCR